MKPHEVTVPQIGLIAGTRAMLGAGIALLLSEKLTTEQRRAIGWTLVAVGALTTIPLVLQLFNEDEGLGCARSSGRMRYSMRRRHALRRPRDPSPGRSRQRT